MSGIFSSGDDGSIGIGVGGVGGRVGDGDGWGIVSSTFPGISGELLLQVGVSIVPILQVE